MKQLQLDLTKIDGLVAKTIDELVDYWKGEYFKALKAMADEELTLQESVEESGYSYSTLQRKVASGEIPNAGTKGAPRIKRKHLPRKAGEHGRRSY